MVDVDIGRRGPGVSVVRALPRARRRVAVGSDLDAGAVALQHRLARAAAARLDPVREQVPVVGSIVYLCRYAKCGELRLGGGRRRDAALRARTVSMDR